MRSAADGVERMSIRQGQPPARRNADDNSTWIVLDFFDVVVHVFEPNTRAYYDLEMLYGDAPKLLIPSIKPPARATRKAPDDT